MSQEVEPRQRGLRVLMHPIDDKMNDFPESEETLRRFKEQCIPLGININNLTKERSKIMAQLLRITEMYRVDDEDQAAALIEQAKADSKDYLLTKYESKVREKKAKGEVIESWVVVTLQKDFD
jgi:hypothetical protein